MVQTRRAKEKETMTKLNYVMANRFSNNKNC